MGVILLDVLTIIILTTIAVGLAIIVNLLMMKSKMFQRSNFGPDEAISTCVELIEKSWREIKIVSDLSETAFNNEEVLAAMDDAVQRGVKFKILCHPDSKVKDVDLFAKFVKKSRR